MSIYFDIADGALPVVPASIGRHWDQEGIHRPKGFPFYHWLQTERGCGEIRIGERQFLLGPQEGVFIAPFVAHAYSKSSEEWTTSFLTFTGKLEADIHKIVGNKSYIRVGAQDGAALQAWIHGIVDLHERRQLDHLKLSEGCYAFLLHMGHTNAEADLQEEPLYRQYVLPTIADIETQYPLQITVGDLAATRYVTPQYLSRLFRRFLGYSVYEYLINYRLNKAKEMLVNRPAMEIQQIAYAVGYLAVSHFIASFREKTGYTPLEFRRLHVGGRG